MPTASVEDRAGEGVAGLLHGELAVHGAPVGLIDGVDQGEQVPVLAIRPYSANA